METLLIKKPDIALLKRQAIELSNILTKPEHYVGPDECFMLQGLVEFCEHVADVAEGYEKVCKDKVYFHVEGRNDYYGVDEYRNPEGDQLSNCVRNIAGFKTRKIADTVCYYMNQLAKELNRVRGLEK